MFYLLIILLVLGFLPTGWFWAVIIFFIIVIPLSEADVRYENYRDRRRYARKRYSNHD